MPRFPCTTADILNAAKRFLVEAGIVSESQTFITLQPDDLLREPPDPPIISVSFFGQDQFLQTLSCEATNETTPTIQGDLIFSVWLRLALDQNLRDDEILTTPAYGFSPIVSQLLHTFNNVQLTNESDQEITWRSLNYVGVRNRGRWMRAPEWRRLDVRFDCTFELQPAPVPPSEENSILYADGEESFTIYTDGGVLVYA
jgi:hypothetical protein